MPRIAVDAADGLRCSRPMNVASPQESSLLLVVPEAERAVREHRAEFDLAARVGVPAHITVAYPFKPVDIMAAKEIERLREMFRTVNPFWVELRTTGWFGDMAARQTLYDASRVRSCHVSSSLTMRRPSSCGPVLHSPLNVQDGSWSKSSLWVGSAPTLLRRQGPLLRRSSCPRATLIGAESAPCPVRTAVERGRDRPARRGQHDRVSGSHRRGQIHHRECVG